MPPATPAAARDRARPSSIRTTSEGAAPTASLIPISFRRRAVSVEITPNTPAALSSTARPAKPDSSNAVSRSLASDAATRPGSIVMR